MSTEMKYSVIASHNHQSSAWETLLWISRAAWLQCLRVPSIKTILKSHQAGKSYVIPMSHEQPIIIELERKSMVSQSSPVPPLVMKTEDVRTECTKKNMETPGNPWNPRRFFPFFA